jgi:hypothetical protein
MAYFYCDYRDPTKQVASTILRSIIRQFAEQNALCFEKLEDFYETKSSEDKASPVIAQNDLITLLHNMCEDVEDALILADALDECLDDRASVMGVLRELSGPGSTNIKTFFASRDEGDISTKLREYTVVSMAENTSNIARYVEAELKIKDWAQDLSYREKETIKDALIEPAGGM